MMDGQGISRFMSSKYEYLGVTIDSLSTYRVSGRENWTGGLYSDKKACQLVTVYQNLPRLCELTQIWDATPQTLIPHHWCSWGLPIPNLLALSDICVHSRLRNLSVTKNERIKHEERRNPLNTWHAKWCTETKKASWTRHNLVRWRYLFWSILPHPPVPSPNNPRILHYKIKRASYLSCVYIQDIVKHIFHYF